MISAIVIQGPTTYYSKMIELYKNTDHVIWCTWDDEEVEAVKAVQQSNIYLHLIPKPVHSGKGNITNQSRSTYEGIVMAKKLYNADMYIKMRSDFDVSNIQLLINRFSELNLPLNFLGWIDVYGGYFLDFIVAGHYSEMLNFWKYDDIADIGEPFAEKYLMFRYFNIANDNYKMEDLIKSNHIVLPSLDNISIYWIKRKKYIKLFGIKMRLNYKKNIFIHKPFLYMRNKAANVIKFISGK